jgi:streptogramin lyase
MRKLLPLILGAAIPLLIAFAQDPAPPQAAAPDAPKKGGGKRPPRPGVSTPGVKREMSTITPTAVFPVEGVPDWQVVTEDAVWVSNGPKGTLHRLDPKSNTVVKAITVGKRPCSGLAAGFDSIWVPNCGDKTISRVSIATNEVIATIPVGPAASEGGIAVGAGSVWIASDPKGFVSRIDPKDNKVIAQITVPAGSAGATFGEGAVWITTPVPGETGTLTKIDPKTNQATAIQVGPQPRFVTTGAGSVWTLNQGDGTVTRIEAATGKKLATIEVGVPGGGGEIDFGGGHVWLTVFQIPLTEIDPVTNTVIRQWVGPGGDAVRFGHGSVWLSNLREQNLWRIDPKKF